MIEKLVHKPKKLAFRAIDSICHRCLGDNIVLGDNNHLYCDDCSSHQTVLDTMYLHRYGRVKIKKNHRLRLPFPLSKSQVMGQAFIQRCFQNQSKGFLHAVCGAGKTEMCLTTILEVMNQGLSVVFVIPRVEIIKQVIKRFNAYFPRSHIVGLYQNQPWDESADLYVSTPQQLIKFYQEFDLVIIDEADAFPFYQNQYLLRLVEKARKKEGVMIYISATMPKPYQDMIDALDFEYCLIPKRFHLKPLVIPVYKTYRYLYSNDILEQIKIYQDKKKKLLVYFPSIHMMSRFHFFLNAHKIQNQMISSKTTYKKPMIKGFEDGVFSILLSTTILERGVTFKGCDAFVLASDHHIFDRDTLIQIAGRVGRDANDSEGHIVFFARHITSAMQKARQSMLDMNKRARNAL